MLKASFCHCTKSMEQLSLKVQLDSHLLKGTSAMRILIIGGTRFLGPPVVRSLHEQGPLSPSFTAVTLHQLP